MINVYFCRRKRMSIKAFSGKLTAGWQQTRSVATGQKRSTLTISTQGK